MKSEYVLIHAAPIKHYGIKGQKKGVRRFQLDNGELTAAGKARYGVGAYGKKVGKTRSSAPSVSAVDSKNPWSKRASAVAPTPTKKETKDNLGQNGGRPYTTPYTQTVAKGRRKVFRTAITVPGATVHKETGINAKKAPAATVGAKTQGAILKAQNAVRVTTQNKAGNSSGNKQLASPAKVDKDKLSSRGNEKTRDNVIKVGADLADIVSDRVKTRDAIAKTQNLLEAASKAGKQIDNGAVDTLKKKDLVKIKSGKNTRR